MNKPTMLLFAFPVYVELPMYLTAIFNASEQKCVCVCVFL